MKRSLESNRGEGHEVGSCTVDDKALVSHHAASLMEDAEWASRRRRVVSDVF